MSDQAARDRIRVSLDESLVVEAAAGTGKTTALVSRLVAVLGSGRARPESIAAVTFTRKAAGELVLRLRDAIDERRSATDDPIERGHLEEAASHLEEARIGTIHGFCGDLLRERPVEAGVDPDFVLLEEGETQRLFGRVFRRWLEGQLADLPSALARALDRLAVSWDEQGPVERLEAAAYSLLEWRDHQAPWQIPAVEALEEGLLERVDRLAHHASKGPGASDPVGKTLEPVVEAAAWLERSRREGTLSPGQREAQLAKLRRELGYRMRYARKGSGQLFGAVPRNLVIAERDELVQTLDTWGRAADARLAAELAGVLRGAIDAYGVEKRRRGVLDFFDLQFAARDLIRSNMPVRQHLQQRFTHLFVDEFQDTDPLQLEVLLLLAARDPAASDWRTTGPRPGALFLVGDPKQSIYRFRRADVEFYRVVRDHLVANGAGLVQLSRSYRAGDQLQAFVNHVFAPLMPGTGGVHQADWVALEPVRPAAPQRPSVVVLPAPEARRRWNGGPLLRGNLEAELPDLVAAFIAWVVRDSGWRFQPPGEDQERCFAPRDFCLLFRKGWDFRKGDTTRGFIQALERRGIAHVASVGRSFFQREEVEALRAALTAIEWPDDELAVYATLRGPMLALSDASLLRYRLAHQGLRPFGRREAVAPGLEPVAAALDLIAKLHRARNRQPVATTVRAILAATRAWAGFALRPAGGEVLAHLERVIELARSFELGGGLSFRAFVERLTDEAESDGAHESPVREENSDGVRLLTAHTAKGLEFPIVVCADPLTSLARNNPDRHLDLERGLAAVPLLGFVPWDLELAREQSLVAQEAEGIRIAYVAATRARELLVLPSTGLGPVDEGTGWVAPLLAAVQPPQGQERAVLPAPGCPNFGATTVRDLDPTNDRGSVVAPGLHQLAAGPVVWWDPLQLELGVPEPRGLEHDGIIASDAPDEAAAPLRSLWQDWVRDNTTSREAGIEPSLRVASVGQMVVPPPTMVSVGVETARVVSRRSAGPRFGTLVHSALQQLALDADLSHVSAVVASLGRSLSATALECDEAAAAVAATLAHPRVAGAHAADRIEREWPFVMPLPDADEGLVEGVVDLAWRRDGRWTVVDYKTDARADLLDYRRQVAWYCWALTAATGEPVEGFVLGV